LGPGSPILGIITPLRVCTPSQLIWEHQTEHNNSDWLNVNIRLNEDNKIALGANCITFRILAMDTSDRHRYFLYVFLVITTFKIIKAAMLAYVLLQDWIQNDGETVEDFQSQSKWDQLFNTLPAQGWKSPICSTNQNQILEILLNAQKYFFLLPISHLLSASSMCAKNILQKRSHSHGILQQSY
jgi:hypothetical protein